MRTARTAPGFTGWCLLEEGAIPADIPAAMEENRREFAKYAGSPRTGAK